VGETENEGVEGPGAHEHKGGRVWHLKPNIECGVLDTGGACGIPPADGSGDRYKEGQTENKGLEGPGARERKGERVWRLKPNIEGGALDTSGMCGIPPADGSGD
jgi:hypothetical protein